MEVGLFAFDPGVESVVERHVGTDTWFHNNSHAFSGCYGDVADLLCYQLQIEASVVIFWEMLWLYFVVIFQ